MDQENYNRLQIEALITEREGMIVANKQREMLGESLAYNENAFFNLANCFYELLKR